MEQVNVVLAFIHNEKMAVTMEELGICCIGANLRKYGYQVKIISQDILHLDYQEILDFQPKVIGLTVYSYSVKTVYEVAKKLKELHRDCLICLGGVYATTNYEEILNTCPEVDYVFIGEGELTFKEFLDAIHAGSDQTNINGIAYKKNDVVILNAPQLAIENLDQMPFAARDILVDKKYKVALLSASRGCISSCSFCASQLFWKKWRGRSPQNIVTEMEEIIEQYGIRIFNIIDSSFEDPYHDLRRPLEVAKTILKKGLFVSYFANLRAEFHRTTNKEEIALLKESGLVAVCVGLETANEEDLILYNKRSTLSDNDKVMQLLLEHDIGIAPGFINFNPYSNMEKLKINLDFITKYRYSILFFTFLNIYKGTKIYNQIEKDQLLADNIYGFHFVDGAVEKLAYYFSNYREELNKACHNSFNIMNFYIVIYPHTLKFYKRYLQKNKHSVQIMEHGIASYLEVVKQFDHSLSYWISMIIDDYEKYRDAERLQHITNQYMPVHQFLTYKKEMDNMRQKLFLDLTRAGFGEMLMLI